MCSPEMETQTIHYNHRKKWSVRTSVIKKLGLSMRAYNGLRRSGFHTIEAVSALDFDEILSIRSIGAKLAVEIWDKVDKYKRGGR